MGQKIIGMEQHADGNKEDARKVIAKRHDLGHDVVAVFRFGDDEPGKERAERERQAEAVGDPGRAEAEEHDEEEEHLPVPEPDHLVEQEGDDLARGDVDADQAEHCLAQGNEHRKQA